MKKFSFAVIILLQFVSGFLFSQPMNKTGADICSEKRIKGKNINKIFDQDSPNSPLHSFDVKTCCIKSGPDTLSKGVSPRNFPDK